MLFNHNLCTRHTKCLINLIKTHMLCTGQNNVRILGRPIFIPFKNNKVPDKQLFYQKTTKIHELSALNQLGMYVITLAGRPLGQSDQNGPCLHSFVRLMITDGSAAYMQEERDVKRIHYDVTAVTRKTSVYVSQSVFVFSYALF